MMKPASGCLVRLGPWHGYCGGPFMVAGPGPGPVTRVRTLTVELVTLSLPGVARWLTRLVHGFASQAIAG